MERNQRINSGFKLVRKSSIQNIYTKKYKLTPIMWSRYIFEKETAFQIFSKTAVHTLCELFENDYFLKN